MGIVHSRDPRIANLQGLHLWHFALSNCSQKVRLALAEKQLRWHSHEVDLARNEHCSAAFLAINPAGLVPVLVDAGVTINESSDIVEHLEQRFPYPALVPAHRATAIRQWMSLQDSVQFAVKVVSHEFLFKPRARKSAGVVERFRDLHPDRGLARFHQRFSSAQGLAREEICEALTTLQAALATLNRELAWQRYLCGEDYTLADLCWTMNLHRLAMMRMNLQHYPHLSRWYRGMRERPSFRAALLAYEPMSLRLGFAAYSLLRRYSGSSPNSLSWCTPGLP